MKKIDQIRYYLIAEKNKNELISKKHKKVLNYIDYSVIAKKHDKIISLAKLNNIEVLFSKPLIDSNISQNEFVLINNMLKEFYDMKEIRNSNDK